MEKIGYENSKDIIEEYFYFISSFYPEISKQNWNLIRPKMQELFDDLSKEMSKMGWNMNDCENFSYKNIVGYLEDNDPVFKKLRVDTEKSLELVDAENRLEELRKKSMLLNFLPEEYKKSFENLGKLPKSEIELVRKEFNDLYEQLEDEMGAQGWDGDLYEELIDEINMGQEREEFLPEAELESQFSFNLETACMVINAKEQFENIEKKLAWYREHSAEQVKKTVEDEALIHNVTLSKNVLEHNAENALLDFHQTLDKQPGKVKRRLERFMDSFLVDGEAIHAAFPGGEHTLLYTSEELSSGVSGIEYLGAERAVEKMGGKILSFKNFYLEKTTGQQFYEDLSKDLGSSELASLKLIDIGIPGYKDKSLFLVQGETENIPRVSEDIVIWNEKKLNAEVQKGRDEMENTEKILSEHNPETQETARLKEMSVIFNTELDKSRNLSNFELPLFSHHLLRNAIKELDAYGLKGKLDESNDIDVEYVDFGDNRKDTLLFDGIAEKFKVGDPVEIINEQMERHNKARERGPEETKTLYESERAQFETTQREVRPEVEQNVAFHNKGQKEPEILNKYSFLTQDELNDLKELQIHLQRSAEGEKQQTVTAYLKTKESVAYKEAANEILEEYGFFPWEIGTNRIDQDEATIYTFYGGMEYSTPREAYHALKGESERAQFDATRREIHFEVGQDVAFCNKGSSNALQGRISKIDEDSVTFQVGNEQMKCDRNKIDIVILPPKPQERGIEDDRDRGKKIESKSSEHNTDLER
jgi:hypothetical protein